ncbi:hypothetical protein TREES_T100021843 [Tupaia chinensis]|uniref:Uncharacterized protein n=1 Tax=Tupaia chinensis TaxID=246437 RepID=L9JH93_TUPCH|nr:hypothetical protein TREES_T100021843 [Tupaia chinensis]
MVMGPDDQLIQSLHSASSFVLIAICPAFSQPGLGSNPTAECAALLSKIDLRKCGILSVCTSETINNVLRFCTGVVTVTMTINDTVITSLACYRQLSLGPESCGLQRQPCAQPHTNSESSPAYPQLTGMVQRTALSLSLTQSFRSDPTHLKISLPLEELDSSG